MQPSTTGGTSYNTSVLDNEPSQPEHPIPKHPTLVPQSPERPTPVPQSPEHPTPGRPTPELSTPERL